MRKLLFFLAWRDQGLIRYNSIWQNVAALFYVGLARQWFGLDYIRDIGVFLIFSLTGTVQGYSVKDLDDAKLDHWWSPDVGVT